MALNFHRAKFCNYMFITKLYNIMKNFMLSINIFPTSHDMSLASNLVSLYKYFKPNSLFYNDCPSLHTFAIYDSGLSTVVFHPICLPTILTVTVPVTNCFKCVYWSVVLYGSKFSQYKMFVKGLISLRVNFCIVSTYLFIYGYHVTI